MNKQNLYFAIFAFFGILLMNRLWYQSQVVEVVPYSELETRLEAHITELKIHDEYIIGTLKEGGRQQTGSGGQ